MMHTGRRITQVVSVSLFLVCAFAVERAPALDLIGYVPYYRMNATYNNNILPTQLGMLNEVRYYGLTVSNTGTLIPHDNSV